jgi:hypothetical protein
MRFLDSAAVAAGAVQLANADRESIGASGSANLPQTSAPAASSSVARSSQSLVVQGDYLTPETLARIFAEARERGVTIDEVRRA